MTKEQIEMKIKEILAKDKSFMGATVEVKYKNKSEAKKHAG
ncbi:MAG: hypothetical protein WA945_01665 [Arcobacteraceae bacterium]